LHTTRGFGIGFVYYAAIVLAYLLRDLLSSSLSTDWPSHASDWREISSHNPPPCTQAWPSALITVTMVMK